MLFTDTEKCINSPIISEDTNTQGEQHSSHILTDDENVDSAMYQGCNIPETQDDYLSTMFDTLSTDYTNVVVNLMEELRNQREDLTIYYVSAFMCILNETKYNIFFNIL